MKQTAASLADTPTGRPRRHTPRWLKVTFAVAGMAFFSRAVYGLMLPPLTPQQDAQLDADARYARWKASPEAAGFERLRDAAFLLHSDERAISNCYTTLLGKARVPSASEIEAAKKDAHRLVARHEKILQVLRESIHQPFALSPWRSTDELAPYFADFRTLARLNTLNAKLKQLDGDTDGAAQDLVIGMEYGKHIMPGGNIVGRLVGIACQAIAARPLWEILPNVSPAASSRLLPQLQQASAVPPVADAITEEKFLGQRTLLQVFGDERFGSRYKASPAFAATTLVWPRRTTFQSYTNYMDSLATLSATPYQPNAPKPQIPSDWLNQLLSPVISKFTFKDTQERANNALLLQAAAVYAFHARNGHFPTTLAETKSPLLPTLPADPFGQNLPLVYRRTGDTFTLYSVGPDGKDDGGTAIVRTDARASAQYLVDVSSNGDMVGGINF